MQWLRTKDANSARALEFTILFAARTGETLFATAAEIDFEAKVWTIPAERMKAREEHRVPLCDRALQIAREGQRRPFCSLAREGASLGRTVRRPFRSTTFSFMLLSLGAGSKL